MFSKNNRFAMERKMSASKQRFGLRKIMGGVALVLLGLTFLYGTRASADEVQPTETVTTIQLATAPTHSELTVPATVLVQIFLADLILVYWMPRNEGLRA